MSQPPYNAAPSTGNETEVTNSVGKQRKESLNKTLDSQIGKRKIRTPSDTVLKYWFR